MISGFSPTLLDFATDFKESDPVQYRTVNLLILARIVTKQIMVLRIAPALDQLEGWEGPRGGLGQEKPADPAETKSRTKKLLFSPTRT